MSLFSHVTQTLQHLPVTPVAEAVVRDTLAGKVTVLAAPTGSGKSMIVPSMIADRSDDPVIVLMPRRFLAVDAASNVAQLAQVKLGQEVGYAVGKMAGDGSLKSKHTRLIFMTYGYALSSGIIHKAKNIVLDEVHERSEDISLVRALLRERKAQDPSLNILEMSATVNAQQQADYWSAVSPTAVHMAEGKAMECDERIEHPSDHKRSLEQAVISLIKDEGRKGIAVFRPGIREINSTVELLKTHAAKHGIQNLEVASIYGGTPPDERRQAKAPPKAGNVKVLVGTNVIESGVNLRWLDSGVSDGKGRIPYDREDTGAKALVLEDLPKWRILQQRGRPNRDPAATGFEAGVFTLHSERGWEFRPQQATPEIERISLTNLAFRAAALGADPTRLTFDGKVTPARLTNAKEALQRLQLIHDDWSLTDEGRYVSGLPVTPEAGALLCEARRLDAASRKPHTLLPDAIILAALLGGDSLRDNYRRSHGRDKTSDLLDSLKAFKELYSSSTAKFVTQVTDEHLENADAEMQEALHDAREKLKQQCSALNVNFSNFCDTARMVREISARHPAKELVSEINPDITAEHYDGLKQAILHGSVNTLFHGKGQFQDLLRNYGSRRNDAGQPFSDYTLAPGCAVDPTQEMAASPLVAGRLYEIPSKTSDTPETVITQATSIPPEVFVRWAAARSDTVLKDFQHGTVRGKDGGKPTQEIEASYFGKAHFSLPLRKLTGEMSTKLAVLANKDRSSSHGAQR